MFDSLDNSIINGMALAIGFLIVLTSVTTFIPLLILDKIGVPRKISSRFIGIFCLLGLGLWIYLMYYLNFLDVFI